MTKGNQTDTNSRLEDADVQAAKEAGTAPAGTAIGTGQLVTIEITGTRPTYSAPEFVQVKRGWRVEFLNNTDGEVSFQFPHRHLFSDRQISRIPMGRTSDPLTVQADVFVGHYPYAAFCHHGNEFAEGGSMPIIIVDPDK